MGGPAGDPAASRALEFEDLADEVIGVGPSGRHGA
jgi:hypothetical protein